MHWTKQQKIVAAVLVLAVAALVVDRWVIGHDDDDVGAARPQHGGTTRRAAPRQPRPAVVKAATEPEAPLGNVAALATRLTYIARKENLDSIAVRDAFRPPSAWAGTTRAASPDEMALAVREFQNRKLTAVITRNSGRGVAIVDQKTVTVGKSLDGFVLVAVKERSAVFRRGGQRVELRLPEEAQPGVVSTSEKVAGVEPSR